mmetsp:Transcript_466/g.1535  ORF Transcript_466/g.1535 Transcript_466/m.1535 type:complete len:240 (-) Transcript_466:453-1172(-)
MDENRLVCIELRPHRNRIELQVSDKVCRASILNLIEEKGLLIRVPICLGVMDLAVRASYVCSDERHRDRLPVWSLELWQHLQCLSAYSLGILKELLRNVVACYYVLLPILSRHSRLVGNSIQELAIEPKDPSLPISHKALNCLLHDILWTIRELLEVVLEDLRVLFAVCYRELSETQGECHEGLLHDEGLPSASFDLLQQRCWTPLALEGEDCGCHRNTSIDAGLHVAGLVVDELLHFP